MTEENQKDHLYLAIILTLGIFGDNCWAEPPRIINGILNGSVILSARKQIHSPFQIQWLADGKIIATFFNGQVNTDRIPEFQNRLNLYKENGSLQINRLQMKDGTNYIVKLLIRNDSKDDVEKYDEDMRLVIYEKINKPVMEVRHNFSTSRICNFSIICFTNTELSTVSECDNIEVFQCSKSSVMDPSSTTSLTITTNGSSILCNSSNVVSWDSDTIVVNDACLHNNKDNGKVNPWKNTRSRLAVVACGVIYIITLSLLCFRGRKKSST